MTIRSEIETRVLNWAKSQVPPIPVAVEGVSFSKPTSGPYLEIWLLGAERVNRDVAATGIRTYGMLQINCYAPAGKGMGEVEALRDNMVMLFPVLPKIGTVSIEAPLNWTGSDVIDGFTFVSVRGRYRVET